jgi:hypothetical protein
MRILAHVKGNLGSKPPSVRFHFVKEEGSSHPHIKWDGCAEDVTADSLLQFEPHNYSARAAAEKFLRETLKFGPMPSKELEELAAERGISNRTYVRAKQAVTTSTRIGGIGTLGKWQTELNTKTSR